MGPDTRNLCQRNAKCTIEKLIFFPKIHLLPSTISSCKKMSSSTRQLTLNPLLTTSQTTFDVSQVRFYYNLTTTCCEQLEVCFKFKTNIDSEHFDSISDSVIKAICVYVHKILTVISKLHCYHNKLQQATCYK